MSASSLPRTILIGVDYSPSSLKAAEFGLELATRVGAQVLLVHAWVAPYASATPSHGPRMDHPNLLDMVRRTAEDAMRQFLAALPTHGVTVSTAVESGDPRSVLLNFCEKHRCDWVVVGKHTHSAVAEWFLGNVAAYVVRHCQVPVLVVPSHDTP